MKKKFFVILVAMTCARMFAQTASEQMWDQLTLQAIENRNIAVNVGAHRAPTKLNFPHVFIDYEASQLYIENTELSENSTYVVKDANDSILLAGTISFHGEDYYSINLQNLPSDEYTIEIETINYIFAGAFSL